MSEIEGRDLLAVSFLCVFNILGTPRNISDELSLIILGTYNPYPVSNMATNILAAFKRHPTFLKGKKYAISPVFEFFLLSPIPVSNVLKIFQIPQRN